MRYFVEFCPNPDVAIVHFDCELPTRKPLDSDDSSFAAQLERAICDVRGVDHVFINRYRIQVSRDSKLFEWMDVISDVVKRVHLDVKSGNIEEQIERAEDETMFVARERELSER